MSLDTHIPRGKVHGLKNVDCVVKLYQDITPIIQSIGHLSEHIDSANYQRYRHRFEELPKGTGLRAFHVSQKSCFVRAALLVGLCCDIHRDRMDTIDGGVADIAFGDFDGGNLQAPHLGHSFQLRGGDVLFIKSKLLFHGVSEVTRGMRYSMVFFTHKGMIRLGEKKGVESAGNGVEEKAEEKDAEEEETEETDEDELY